MAITAPPGGAGDNKAPAAEKPDQKAAGERHAGEDRLGFDLGGAHDRPAPSDKDAPAGSNVIPGGPSAPAGANAEQSGNAGSAGMSSGTAQTVGGTVGGSRPGEATQASPGAVRPPQSTGADQTFRQGNPDDAA